MYFGFDIQKFMMDFTNLPDDASIWGLLLWSIKIFSFFGFFLYSMFFIDYIICLLWRVLWKTCSMCLISIMIGKRISFKNCWKIVMTLTVAKRGIKYLLRKNK